MLGAIVTVPINAVSARSGDGFVAGGGTMAVAAITAPFPGMVAGLVVKLLGSMAGL